MVTFRLSFGYVVVPFRLWFNKRPPRTGISGHTFYSLGEDFDCISVFIEHFGYISVFRAYYGYVSVVLWSHVGYGSNERPPSTGSPGASPCVHMCACLRALSCLCYTCAIFRLYRGWI